MGTRDYISPEMVNDSVSGPFSDVWALGIIVYELYTGKRPFRGYNELEIYEQIKGGNFEYTKEIPKDA